MDKAEYQQRLEELTACMEAKDYAAAREIADCGLWYLAEYENGEFTLNRDPKQFTSVEAYLKRQARFKHLTDDDIRVIIDSRDKKWAKIRQNWKTKE